MTHKDVIILGVSWLIIVCMAGYGAAQLLGTAAWIYVVFFILYMYYVNDLQNRRKK